MENGPPLVSIPLAEYQLLAKNYKQAVADATALELGDAQIALGRDIQQWLIRGMEHVLALHTPSPDMLEMQAFLTILRSAKLVMLIVHKPISDAERLGVVPVSDGPLDQGARAAHPPRSTPAVTDAELVQLGERAVRGYLDFDEARKWFAERQP